MTLLFTLIGAVISALLLCGTQFTDLFGAVLEGHILSGLIIANAVVNAINVVLHPAVTQGVVKLARKLNLVH